jgi:hypothetical protein
MSGQNLNPRAPYKHPAFEGLSREAMIIGRVLAVAGLCYVVFSAATDTGLVRWLNECEASLNNGLYHPHFTMASAMGLALTLPLGVARLFDRVTGRGTRLASKK